MSDKSYLTIEERLQKLEQGKIYSTEEQAVGIWIDGKTLYRRGLKVGRVNAGTNETKMHGIENIDKKVNIFGRDIEGGNVLPYVTGDTRYSASLGNFNTTSFQLITGSATTLYDLIVFFEYTKN